MGLSSTDFCGSAPFSKTTPTSWLLKARLSPHEDELRQSRKMNRGVTLCGRDIRKGQPSYKCCCDIVTLLCASEYKTVVEMKIQRSGRVMHDVIAGAQSTFRALPEGITGGEMGLARSVYVFRRRDVA